MWLVDTCLVHVLVEWFVSTPNAWPFDLLDLDAGTLWVPAL